MFRYARFDTRVSEANQRWWPTNGNPSAEKLIAYDDGCLQLGLQLRSICKSSMKSCPANVPNRSVRTEASPPSPRLPSCFSFLHDREQMLNGLTRLGSNPRTTPE